MDTIWIHMALLLCCLVQLLQQGPEGALPKGIRTSWSEAVLKAWQPFSCASTDPSLGDEPTNLGIMKLYSSAKQ